MVTSIDKSKSIMEIHGMFAMVESMFGSNIHGRILILAQEKGTITAVELGEELGLDVQKALLYIRSMEAGGILKRESAGPANTPPAMGRYRLTPEGRRLSKLSKENMASFNALFDEFTDQEIACFTMLAEKMKYTLKKKNLRR